MTRPGRSPRNPLHEIPGHGPDPSFLSPTGPLFGANSALGSTAGRMARGDGALSAGAPARDLASPRWMSSVSRAGKGRCSAESSERSSLATTPEPRRDRLGSLPTPHPRFPPPSIRKIGDLLAAGQTHDAELSLCLIGGAGDQRRRGRPADVTICVARVSEGSRLSASTPVRDLTETIGMKAIQGCRFSLVAGR